MALGKKKAEEIDPAAQAARLEATEEEKKKARRWFNQAKEMANQKNWDYAIECYISGLGFWPEAVEEGHQLLRFSASERAVRGGKKPGFSDTMKRSLTGKDARKAMLNAEWLLAHEPKNISYMEGILKNANKLRAEETLRWIAPIYSNAAEGEPKRNPKRFALLREICEEAGDRAMARGEAALAAEFFERASTALQMQSQADPKNLSLENELRDLSTKLTILRGKYESAADFTESIRDADEQKAAYDKDRMIQDDSGLADLVKRAEKDLAENPGNPGKVETLVELLCRREREEDEKRAIAILVDQFKRFDDFRFKMRAEDIRAKQLRRAYRAARETDKDEARKQLATLLKFEIASYLERVKQYPTDNRLKYELANRLFQARKFDDAIPHFQAARADPKVRTLSDLHLGRCFYENKFFAQAITTLAKAVQNHEIPDDIVAKNLRYWLARSLEAGNKLDEAREVYGEVLQLDYNFLDVKDRLQALT